MAGMKSIFESKTAALAAVTMLTGAAGVFLPEVKEFVAGNSEVILMILGLTSLVLRVVTKDGVQLFPN